ncbi:hypothetical protein AVEN_155045-1 [Araneus ventricosus]|uniref:Uncharacterized protein n=1 Tax=Araneus ventricosus TaxID=182803 RepID=A0A4Y2A8J8_ARAVE|nr:hypothetical protein AVEN_155045-1 [Araneus ventricosus]
MVSAISPKRGRAFTSSLDFVFRKGRSLYQYANRRLHSNPDLPVAPLLLAGSVLLLTRCCCVYMESEVEMLQTVILPNHRDGIGLEHNSSSVRK